MIGNKQVFIFTVNPMCLSRPFVAQSEGEILTMSMVPNGELAGLACFIKL